MLDDGDVVKFDPNGHTDVDGLIKLVDVEGYSKVFWAWQLVDLRLATILKGMKPTGYDKMVFRAQYLSLPDCPMRMHQPCAALQEYGDAHR